METKRQKLESVSGIRTLLADCLKGWTKVKRMSLKNMNSKGIWQIQMCITYVT